MFKNAIFLFLIFNLTSLVFSRIIVEIKGGELSCYYHQVKDSNTKGSFYFSVNSGGDYLISLVVEDSQRREIIKAESARQGNYAFTAHHPGEYKFCFYNHGSETKNVEFDMIIQGEQDNHSPLKFKDPEHLDKMDRSLINLQNGIFEILREQNIFRTQELRNSDTITRLANHLHKFQVYIVIITVTMAVIQSLAIRSFFA